MITFGFTKLNGVNTYSPEKMTANQLTDFFGRITNIINDETTPKKKQWVLEKAGFTMSLRDMLIADNPTAKEVLKYQNSCCLFKTYFEK